MRITTYDLVKVTRDGDGDAVNVRGAVVDGGTGFILLDIEHRHLTYEVVHLIWRAVWSADHVAIVGPADASHALAADLAERCGQSETVERLDAEDAEASAAAFDAALDDLAAMREHMTATFGAVVEVSA